jgi:glyoxylase-like metal-dependent hydrolase (beta-lactamase superfamily II)
MSERHNNPHVIPENQYICTTDNTNIPMTKIFPILFSLLAPVLLFISCRGIKKAQKVDQYIEKESYEIVVNDNATKKITLDYIGCSGFLIRRNNEAVLVDPYFSNLGPLPAVLTKDVKTDSAEVDTFFMDRFPGGKDEAGIIKFIPVTHTHYDHLADVPYIFDNYVNQDSVELLGSNSMVNTMYQLLQDSSDHFSRYKITSAEPDLSSLKKVGQTYLDKGKNIRITPIHSTHAPHFYLGLHFFQGDVSWQKDFKTHKSGAWKEGVPLSFLIDFLDENQKSELRIYIAGSATDAPLGCPPQSLIADKKIDVAILCMASYKFAKKFPEAIFDCLLRENQPTQIIFSHWENFFQPLKEVRETPMVVFGTSAKKFLKIVNKDKTFQNSKSEWTLPMPGIQIKVKY